MTGLPFTTVVFASLCASVFGFSIVRGGVCTLAAIEEVVLESKWRRLQGFAELWIWVIAFFLIGYFGWGFQVTSASYAVTLASILGGVLLGLGAFINQACPFGTIAGIGSGHWSYLATPVGLFVGSVIHYRHLSFLSPLHSDSSGPLFSVSPLVLVPILAFLIWRLTRIARWLASSGAPASPLRSAWNPLSASVMVGLSFSALALSVGAWSYTQLLSDLATHRYELLSERLIFFVAMFAGSLVGGLTDRGWSPKPATLRGILRCFAGGCVMGIGNRLVPGAHDSLTLIGQPLLLSYAWSAMISIYLTLGVLYLLVKRRRCKS